MAQFTKYTGTVTGQVGSLITALDAILLPQGWTKPYTGTNKAVYQMLGGNQRFLRVDDNGPGAGTAKEARMTMYETMSDADTGTGPSPTAAQGVGGVAMVVLRKSVSLDGVARTYKAWADDRTLLWFCLSEGVAGQYYGFMAGDFKSMLAGDAYRTMICGRGTENGALSSSERICTMSNTTSDAGNGFFIARGHTGSGGSVLATRSSDYAKGATAAVGFAGTVPYPNPADGGLYAAPVTISDTSTAPVYGVRGRLRGLWVPLHAVLSYNDGDTFQIAGRNFELVKSVYTPAGVAAIETSNTLETD